MIIKLSLKKVRQVVFFLILFLGVGFVGFKIGFSRAKPLTAKADLSLFWLVWHQLEEKYLVSEDLNPQKMIEGAISGMVASLDDPYTVFLPPEDNKINKEDLTGEFGGVGIQLGYKDSILAVISPLEGTPAERAGVKAGDLILRIKDEANGVDQSTERISLPEAVKLIRGKDGTEVKLTLSREETEKPFEVAITRGTIVVPAIVHRWEEKEGKRFAYIHLLQFSEKMNQQWLDWVSEIERESRKADFGGVILDLRNNPGGYLQGAVFVAGEFLERGKVVVWQEDYRQKRVKFAVDRQGKLLRVPLMVLVNGGSASAAEILAGALRDHQRAEVVGVKTFGKGTIQEPQELPDKAGLHITIARWLLPKGDSIHEEGIKPDIEVDWKNGEGKDLILEEALDILIK